MPNVTIISPDQIDPVGDRDMYDFGSYAKCLAQGDSWFSIGAIPFWATTNLLAQLTLKEGAIVVNCAYPGTELAHMTEAVADTKFLKLLVGPMSYKWDVILLSGGGNDLIDALAVLPTPDNKKLRILLTSDQWDNTTTDVSRYICPDGWATFEAHMRIVVDAFIAKRDEGDNKGVPVVMHTYDYPTPRNVGAGPLGPWLYPVLDTLYKIPQGDWPALAKLLIDMLAALLQAIATEHAADNLTVVNTLGTIDPAAPGSSGQNGDWENEIHPDAHGYVRLAAKLQPVLEGILFT